jgi:hypothetical protein
MKDGAFASDGPATAHSTELRWRSSAINDRPNFSFPHAITDREERRQHKETEATRANVGRFARVVSALSEGI